jgi:hypothetical protein
VIILYSQNLLEIEIAIMIHTKVPYLDLSHYALRGEGTIRATRMFGVQRHRVIKRPALTESLIGSHAGTEMGILEQSLDLEPNQCRRVIWPSLAETLFNSSEKSFIDRVQRVPRCCRRRSTIRTGLTETLLDSRAGLETEIPSDRAGRRCFDAT